MQRDAPGEFKASRIPHSRFLDLDGVKSDSPLPHMLPSEAQFAAACDALEIGNDDSVVVYDRLGVFSAPRAWWMFKAFGHDAVSVLDGGLPAWAAAGLAVSQDAVSEADVLAATTAASHPSPSPRYRAALRHAQVAGLEAVTQRVRSGGDEVLLDARPAPRFNGTGPEPRPGLPSGHMPGAVSVPFTDMLQGGLGGAYKPPDQLAALFKAAGVDLRQPLVATCGTGVTACVVALALYQLGVAAPVVYDGSWAEYGARKDTPKACEAPYDSFQ